MLIVLCKGWGYLINVVTTSHFFLVQNPLPLCEWPFVYFLLLLIFLSIELKWKEECYRIFIYNAKKKHSKVLQQDNHHFEEPRFCFRKIFRMKSRFWNVIDVLTTFELVVQYFKWCPLTVLSHLLQKCTENTRGLPGSALFFTPYFSGLPHYLF